MSVSDRIINLSLIMLLTKANKLLPIAVVKVSTNNGYMSLGQGQFRTFNFDWNRSDLITLCASDSLRFRVDYNDSWFCLVFISAGTSLQEWLLVANLCQPASQPVTAWKFERLRHCSCNVQFVENGKKNGANWMASSSSGLCSVSERWRETNNKIKFIMHQIPSRHNTVHWSSRWI